MYADRFLFKFSHQIIKVLAWPVALIEGTALLLVGGIYAIIARMTRWTD